MIQRGFTLPYLSSFAISDRERQKRKGRNESRGLEITDRLIEHSWFRRKFGASRSAGSRDLHLSRGFIAYNIWIGWVVEPRDRCSSGSNVDKAELSACPGMGKGGSIVSRKKKERKKMAHYSVAVDPCFSIFYEQPTLSYNYVRTYTTYCQFFRQWCSFDTYISIPPKLFCDFCILLEYVFFYLFITTFLSVYYIIKYYLSKVLSFFFYYVWTITERWRIIYFKEYNALLF